MKKLLHAVNHCHTLNICHRDLKPANILLSCPGGDADVKIVDFGVAKHSSTPMTEFIGTPYYLAPEVFSGIYGKECDIWSLGVMLHFMLVLRHPFTGKNL
mmetsp:Transcript_20596/g.3337  ORF Transcript_20596/g.3337 Transcript_20596/m.3337 type:complete len:100 (+) Transcript_20596:396-695(+)